MPVLTSDILQGTLTGSGTQDTIVTAAVGSAQEMINVQFNNYSVSTRTLQVWVNAVSNQGRILNISLATGESVIIRIQFGPSDVMYAEASAATSIAWTLTKGVLT